MSRNASCLGCSVQARVNEITLGAATGFLQISSENKVSLPNGTHERWYILNNQGIIHADESPEPTGMPSYDPSTTQATFTGVTSQSNGAVYVHEIYDGPDSSTAALLSSEKKRCDVLCVVDCQGNQLSMPLQNNMLLPDGSLIEIGSGDPDVDQIQTYLDGIYSDLVRDGDCWIRLTDCCKPVVEDLKLKRVCCRVYLGFERYVFDNWGGSDQRLDSLAASPIPSGNYPLTFTTGSGQSIEIMEYIEGTSVPSDSSQPYSISNVRITSAGQAIAISGGTNTVGFVVRQSTQRDHGDCGKDSSGFKFVDLDAVGGAAESVVTTAPLIVFPRPDGTLDPLIGGTISNPEPGKYTGTANTNTDNDVNVQFSQTPYLYEYHHTGTSGTFALLIEMFYRAHVQISQDPVTGDWLDPDGVNRNTLQQGDSFYCASAEPEDKQVRECAVIPSLCHLGTEAGGPAEAIAKVLLNITVVGCVSLEGVSYDIIYKNGETENIPGVLHDNLAPDGTMEVLQDLVLTNPAWVDGFDIKLNLEDSCDA